VGRREKSQTDCHNYNMWKSCEVDGIRVQPGCL
jgi:hypothetical protein